MFSEASLLMFSYAMFLGVYGFALFKSFSWFQLLYICRSEQVSSDFKRELWYYAAPWFLISILGLVFIVTQ